MITKCMKIAMVTFGAALWVAQSFAQVPVPVETYKQGMAAYQRGDMKEAARQFEAAVLELSGTVGVRHANTLTAIGNLAVTYGYLGRKAEQLALNEKVFKLRTETQGEHHPDTLLSMSNLAVIYGDLGRTGEQLALNEKLLKLRAGGLGERHPNTLLSMSNLAFTYGALGRTAEQLALNEKVLKLRTEILGERHPQTLSSMNNLATTYGALGRTAEQLALNEKVVKLRTEILGARHPDTLLSMSNLALTYHALGRASEQLALNEKILKLSTEILGERHPDTLISMANLAATYGDLGRTTEQLALSENVLKLSTEILGARHPDTLKSMSNLAATYGALGRTADQLTLNEKVLKLRTETLGERHPGTLVSMNNLASTYGVLGRTAEKLALNEKVLKLSTEIMGERHLHTLVAMSNLASTYSMLGRTAEDLALTEKVMRLRTEILGERHPDTLLSMSNLSVTYGNLGRTAEQLALNEKILKLRTETLGERHPHSLVSMSNLAVTYHALGRAAEQLALNEKVLKLRTEILGERHPDTLGAMNNLAATYGAQGRTAEKLALNGKTLKLRTEILGERHPDTLISMSNLAMAYHDLGRPAEQLVLNEKVLKLRLEILGGHHPDTLNSMSNLASTYGVLGRTAEQLALNERVFKLRTEIQGERHPETLAAMGNLAWTYKALKRPSDAAALSARFVSGAEWQRSQPGLSNENRQSLFQPYSEGYRFFSAVHGSLGQLSEGFGLTELSKARTLLESMTAQRARRSGVLPASEQASLDSINSQIAANNNLIAQAKSTQAKQNLEATRNDLVRQYDALQNRLKTQYPKYAQINDVKVFAVANLADLLPKDALAISYILNGNEVSVWLVDTAGKPQFVDLGKVAYIDEAVEALRRASADVNSLKGVATPSDDNAEPKRAWRLPDGSYRLLALTQPTPKDAKPVADVAEIADYLSIKLLRPISAELQAKPQWIVSPDGPLARLPFDLLSLGGQQVLEKHQVHNIQSLSIYALAKAKEKQYQGLSRAKELFAMGNPVYEALSSVPISADARKAKLRSAPTLLEEQLKDLKGYWPNLPGTKAEIDSLVKIFPKNDTYMQAQASESKLQDLNASGALKNYRYLHFAVHGNLSTADPALSSLVLSQQNIKSGTDGYITAAEWPGYDLRSDVTVLSACETGLGKTISGEGVMGLPFALFVAGSVNTVLSLWPVADEATSEFMRGYFAKLKAGQTPAQALTSTKREFAKHPKFSNPFFWASFVLVGAG